MIPHDERVCMHMAIVGVIDARCIGEKCSEYEKCIAERTEAICGLGRSKIDEEYKKYYRAGMRALGRKPIGGTLTHSRSIKPDGYI